MISGYQLFPYTGTIAVYPLHRLNYQEVLKDMAIDFRGQGVKDGSVVETFLKLHGMGPPMPDLVPQRSDCFKILMFRFHERKK